MGRHKRREGDNLHLFATDWHEFFNVAIGGERKGDSVSRRGWKLSACGFLKRIGSVQRRA